MKNNSLYQLQPPQPKRTYSNADVHPASTDEQQDPRQNMFFKDTVEEEEEDSGIKSGKSNRF